MLMVADGAKEATATTGVWKVGGGQRAKPKKREVRVLANTARRVVEGERRRN